MFTREHLQEMGRDYENAIVAREVDIFVSYIREGILKYANLGHTKIKFPLLHRSREIQHAPNGQLDKYNPGPIPETYLPSVIRKLKEIFPDSDFMAIDGMLYISWL